MTRPFPTSKRRVLKTHGRLLAELAEADSQERVTLAMVRREARRVYGPDASLRCWSDPWQESVDINKGGVSVLHVRSAVSGHVALRALYAALRTMPGRKT